MSEIGSRLNRQRLSLVPGFYGVGLSKRSDLIERSITQPESEGERVVSSRCPQGARAIRGGERKGVSGVAATTGV